MVVISNNKNVVQPVECIQRTALHTSDDVLYCANENKVATRHRAIALNGTSEAGAERPRKRLHFSYARNKTATIRLLWAENVGSTDAVFVCVIILSLSN